MRNLSKYTLEQLETYKELRARICPLKCRDKNHTCANERCQTLIEDIMAIIVERPKDYDYKDWG
jgi:hypothetical protein